MPVVSPTLAEGSRPSWKINCAVEANLSDAKSVVAQALSKVPETMPHKGTAQFAKAVDASDDCQQCFFKMIAIDGQNVAK